MAFLTDITSILSPIWGNEKLRAGEESKGSGREVKDFFGLQGRGAGRSEWPMR